MTTTPSAGRSPDDASPGSQRSTLVAAMVAVVGLGLLWIHFDRYPALDPSTLSESALALPRTSNLWAILRALGWLALINVSAICLGAGFERWLPVSSALARFRLLYQLGIGFSLLGLGVLLLASIHRLEFVGFASLLLLPPALTMIFSRNWLKTSRVRLATVFRDRTVNWAWIASAILLANAFVRVFDDDLGWDALTYHLAFPELYLFDNGIVMTPFSHLSGYVAATEMLYLLALYLEGPKLAVLIHFEFGLLTLVALWKLGAIVSRRAAILAPLFLLADPLFQTELGWAYSDLSLGFYFTLAAIAISSFLEGRGAAEVRRSDLIYAGIACGLCCATRYLGASVGFAMVVLVCLPPRLFLWRDNLKTCLTLGTTTAVVLMPWFIRNLTFTGNPITPLLQSMFHGPGEEWIVPIVMGQSTEFLKQAGMGQDLGALLALPWNLTMNSRPGTYQDSFGFQVSALVLIGLLAVVGLVASGRRLRSIPLLVPMLELSGLFTLIWFFTFQEARFLLPVFPLLAFSGAVATEQLATSWPRFGRSLLLLPAFAVLHTQIAMLTTLTSSSAIASEKSARHAPEVAANFLRDEMAPEDRLWLWMEQRGYLFRGVDYVPYHIGSGSPSLALVHRFTDYTSLHCELRAMEITHILINRQFARIAQPGLFGPDYTRDDFVAGRTRVNQLVHHGAEQLFSAQGFEVYRLDRGTCPPPPPSSRIDHADD